MSINTIPRNRPILYKINGKVHTDRPKFLLHTIGKIYTQIKHTKKV
jgi:hypothetical protein